MKDKLVTIHTKIRKVRKKQICQIGQLHSYTFIYISTSIYFPYINICIIVMIKNYFLINIFVTIKTKIGNFEHKQAL